MTRTPTRAARRPRSGRHRLRGWIGALVIIAVLLVAVDFAAKAVAENVIAQKIKQQGLQHKPSVTIDGFPFLTQAASKDFRQVDLRDRDQTEGPVTITTISATARNIKVNSFSFSSGTIGSLSGSALISFASLGDTLTKEVGPLGSLLHGAGLRLSAAGPHEVRASVNVLVVSGTATWRVSLLSGDRLRIRLVGSTGLNRSLLGAIQDITLQIPKLPLGLHIDSVRVTPSGVVGRVRARNVPFG